MVTHDNEIARSANRTITLRDGKLEKQATTLSSKITGKSENDKTGTAVELNEK